MRMRIKSRIHVGYHRLRHFGRDAHSRLTKVAEIGSVSMAAFMTAQEQNTKAPSSQPVNSNGEGMSEPVTHDDEDTASASGE